MNLLTPLGLLGLLAVAVLIVIYVIRPSYQNKSIPSTYIWKESLKYRKRQKPGNLFRNLLIILCQILILSICALILATPFLQTRSAKDVDQNIIVIDASANMLAASGGTTRFGRAVSRAKEFAAESVRDKTPVSVILAGTRANCVVSKEVSIDIIEEKLNEAVCSYGSGDVAGAMKLAGDLTADSYAQVYFYTATAYENAGDIAVVNVSSEEDWNACALDLRAESEENYFEFSADVAVYGKDKYLKLSLSVEGVNGDGRTVRAEKRVNCTDGETVTVTFADLDIYGYESASLSIAVDDGTADSFPYDDSFFLYGGKKETIRIQYASSLPNNFLSGALLVLKNRYRDQWDIEISEPTKSKDIETSGFDFYIFEHAMPSAMPTDGVVILVDPDQIPRGLELSLGQIRNGTYTMAAGAVNPITDFIDASSVTAVTYRAIAQAEGFETLMYCEGDSVFAVKNEPDEKVAVLTLDLNRSNLPVLLEFPVLVNNMFEYFLPCTLQKSVFDVGETIAVDARGVDVTLTGGAEEKYLETPASVVIETPGSYRITQTLLSSAETAADFFVKISAAESDFNRAEKEIPGVLQIQTAQDEQGDLYLYLAIALTFVLIAERFLYSRENI